MAKWRLAQRNDDDEKNGAGAKAPAAKKRERKPGELSTAQKAVIIVFIVIFALSTLAGALASVFQSTQSQSVEYNVDYVDSQYTDYVADLESKLEDDPENTETLLSAARATSSWGTSVLMLATTDDETSHGEELIERSIGYYDRYLELDNASDARCERAMCEYYLGDVESATADLQSVTADDPEYAPAWSYLGVVYETQGMNDEAIEAYQKALELDPDDELGVRSDVQARIDELTGATDDSSDDAATDDATETDATETDATETDANANTTEDSSEAGE